MSRKRQSYSAVVTTQNPESILTDLTKSLDEGKILNDTAVKAAGVSLIDEATSNETKAAFLTAWQLRGEVASEVATLADFFRDHSRNPGLEAFAPSAIDIVGTGGDKSGTFNISTTTALIVAAGGVPVIKHGNRSITSKAGSADLLEAIGIPLQADDSIIKASLEENNFTFLFAPAYHPAFKTIVPVRRALAEQGRKTVFNILGPLINPARPHFQIMGVFHDSWVSPLAEVLTQVGLKSGIVASSSVSGQAMDEITSIGVNTLSPVGLLNQEDIAELQRLISKYKEGSFTELKGGDFETNLNILKSVLSYRAPETLLHTLCINAGTAFRIVGKVDSFVNGYDLAAELLKSGKVNAWVKRTSNFFSSYQ